MMLLENREAEEEARKKKQEERKEWQQKVMNEAIERGLITADDIAKYDKRRLPSYVKELEKQMHPESVVEETGKFSYTVYPFIYVPLI